MVELLDSNEKNLVNYHDRIVELESRVRKLEKLLIEKLEHDERCIQDKKSFVQNQPDFWTLHYNQLRDEVWSRKDD